uniref:EF-hand domain-containing protein n=1 Tax=Daphnia galeata TaxID=27404 RepID=A0A8J2S6Z9_9CRUS|nr:unnamed protein product [Daphnia galeata]
MKTVTVRRHVTVLTASTPFAKPPVRKMKDQLGFSRKELQLMYRSFKQECPSGTVNEATFKRIYTHFFPYGGKSKNERNFWTRLKRHYNVSPYAHCVFRAFDIRHNGVINFEDLVLGVSALSRGSVPDKLRWVFTLYDADGDGVISRSELRDVVMAIHRLSPHGNLLSSKTIPDMMPSPSTTNSAAAMAERRNHEMFAERHADRIFQKLDLNCDGQVTWDEFLETCTKDETIANTMANMDVAL